MRALLERSTLARVAVALAAVVCILGLVHEADAGDDFGLPRASFIPDGVFTAFGLPIPARAADPEPVLLTGPVEKHLRPRRIWAAAKGRPLRIALQRPRKLAPATKTAVRVGERHPHRASSAEAFRLVPPPVRTALVSIYGDRTLRSGDAVMLQDGIHVFRDDGFWPHRPRDFVRLRSVAGLDWHLRRTLEPFDNNPPTRWTSIMVPPA